MQTFIAAVLIFGALILVHELGHFYAARLTGIRVLELALGFGPKLFSWNKKGTTYSLRAVPLGGFCRMLGEDPAEAAEPGSFSSQPVSSRALVLAAGALMNLLLAIALFFVIFFFITGVPGESTAVGYLVEESPAALAGLQEGDILLSVDGAALKNWDDVLQEIGARPTQEIELKLRRSGAELSLNIKTMTSPETGRGMIGIGPTMPKYRLFSSLKLSFERFIMIIGSIAAVFTGKAPLDVTGPVGIIFVIGEVAQTGFVNLMLLASLLSISLGIMNLLPVPALDGGRLLFLLVEAIRGKKIEPEKEGVIHFIGFALLIALILFITYQDILRWVLNPAH